MRHTVILVATAVYTAVFIAAFDALRESVMIPSIALIGLCGWLYGPRTGAASVPFYVLLHIILLRILSNNASDCRLTFNPTGIVLAFITAVATGLLKESCDRLNLRKASLAQRVREATAQRDAAVRSLLEREDQARTQIGQDLHDGAGQYLTGMLLHSESLHQSLEQAGRVESGMAQWMTRRIEKSIHTVRQLSRSLLPIQFSETGLEAALREMTAYFSEFTTAGIALNCCGDSTAVPGMMAHHIHQILHEALYRAICKIKADDISVRLHIVRSRCKVLVRGRIPCSKIPAPDEFVSDIMKYRIGLIGAQHAFTVHSDRGFSLACEAALSTEETE